MNQTFTKLLAFHYSLPMWFQHLPVDLISEIFAELDLQSLISVSYTCKRFYAVAADPSLNPWRRPILRNLHSKTYEHALKHLSVRLTVPRQNWIEILATASPSFILYEATLPNLKATEWEECFKRRFLPSWRKYRRESSWKEAFLKVLHRIWHRSVTSCTTDETWTKYIVLNRNGSANELEASSRNYNPVTIFNEMKLQNSLSQFETSVRLVVELPDVKVLAFGTLAKPRSNMMVNPNAHIFINPPGIEADGQTCLFPGIASLQTSNGLINDHGVYPMSPTTYVPPYLVNEYTMPSTSYRRLVYPQPASSYKNFPFYTPGGRDLRWIGSEHIKEEGLHWVGGLMIFAQIHTPSQDSDASQGRQQYASFSWTDLWALAPWMEERITKRIDGAGLGN